MFESPTDVAFNIFGFSVYYYEDLIGQILLYLTDKDNTPDFGILKNYGINEDEYEGECVITFDFSLKNEINDENKHRLIYNVLTGDILFHFENNENSEPIYFDVLIFEQQELIFNQVIKVVRQIIKENYNK